MQKTTLTNEEIGSLCLGLSLLLHSGVSVADGLYLLAQDEQSSPYRDLLTAMADEADGGATLAQAARSSGSFPAYVCGLLEVGERSGRTEEALNALAQHYENRASLDRRLRSALLYPAILLLIMLAVVVVLLVYVLPIFDDVYAQLGGSLTGVAGGLLAFGQTLSGLMPVLCAILGVFVVLLVLFAASDRFREKILGFWRSHWGDKGISQKINLARFAQSMSMGMSSGLPVEEAVQLSSELLKGTPGIEARAEKCLSLLNSGSSVAQAMDEAQLLPKAQCRLLDTGIRSGSGDTAMEQVARRLSEESEAALDERIGQVEPALVIISCVLVGRILLSVMLPLLHIMAAIG